MEISNQIISVIDALCEKLGFAVDWTQQNVLPQIQLLFEKYIRYEIFSSVATIVISVMVSLAIALITKKCHVVAVKEKWNVDCGLVWLAYVAWIMLGISVLVTFVVFCQQSMDIVRCLTFPELQVMEYLNAPK